MARRLRGIIWSAVSSEEQARDDKSSLDTQYSESMDFADQNEIDIIDVITVGGFSRRFYNYPEFVEAAAEDGFDDPKRMIEHWKRRDFDVLLARDGSRLGREQGILGEFVAKTVHGGARLHMNSGGWVDESNYREYTAINGYSAAKEVDRFVKGSRDTKIKNASRGLTTGPSIPYSHRWVRDERGKLLRLELDERKTRLWEDLATVFLAGISYAKLEDVLYERYGHVHEKSGNPFAKTFFHRLLHNPYFWGHAAFGFRSATVKNGQKIGAWAYDPTCPPPEGVPIFYNVNPPVYTDELATRIIDELRRRSQTIRGKARPKGTHKFTGLLLCGKCGRYMVVHTTSYDCVSSINSRSENRCLDRPHVRGWKVQEWLHHKLVQMMEHDMPELLSTRNQQTNHAGRIHTLEHELNELREQARTLVMKQVSAHSAVHSIYDEQLHSIGERLEILQKALDQTKREASINDASRVRLAFSEMPVNIADFWNWESTIINQLLHRLMGQRRMVVVNGEIIGTTDAPPHFKRKDRKRRYFGKHRGADFEIAV